MLADAKVGEGRAKDALRLDKVFRGEEAHIVCTRIVFGGLIGGVIRIDIQSKYHCFWIFCFEGCALNEAQILKKKNTIYSTDEADKDFWFVFVVQFVFVFVF